MKFSLITASFNSQSTLRETIESVSSQSHFPIEYIIIDGNSTDGTREIIQSYSSKISKFISEPDQGIYDALNKGITIATGDIIGFLHADDTYASSEVINKVSSSFIQFPDIWAVYGRSAICFPKSPKQGDPNMEKQPFS